MMAVMIMIELYQVKFIYSEKVTNFCEISNIDLSYVVTVKSTVDISQNFVAFSEYMNIDIGSRRIHVDFEMCFLKYSDYGTYLSINLFPMSYNYQDHCDTALSTT